METMAPPEAALDTSKLEDYSLAKLEELFIDSLWWYYREGKPILENKEFDALKQELYKRESAFPTLSRNEVAFVKASIAYYRGEPVISDAEYEALKSSVSQSGQRKDVTAFLLYERGQTLLDDDQYTAMKEEYEKLGISAVDLDKCSLAQLEEMYVDVLWAYHHDGVQLLSDEQYDKLKQELNWQASGFPSLSKYEVNFVKASLAFYAGKPVMEDQEYAELRDKVLSTGRRKDVTAFLLYSKGTEMLDAETFEIMKDEMQKIGLDVKKADTKALQETVSISSDVLKNDRGQVLFMVGSLAAIPTVLSTVLVWAAGLFYDYEFVPEPEWASVLTAEFLPLFGIGLSLGNIITYALLCFLDLQNPTVLVGECPSCSSEVKLFSGGADPAETVPFSCKECGCTMRLNTRSRRIESAGVGTKFGPETDDDFSFRKAWGNLKDQVFPTAA